MLQGIRPNKIESKVSYTPFGAPYNEYVFVDNYISKWDKYLIDKDFNFYEISDVNDIEVGFKVKSLVKIKGELDKDKNYYISNDLSGIMTSFREKRLKQILEK